MKETRIEHLKNPCTIDIVTALNSNQKDGYEVSNVLTTSCYNGGIGSTSYLTIVFTKETKENK